MAVNVPTASWIQTTPSDFVQSAAAGARLGLQKSAQTQDANQFNARMAAQSEQMAMERERMAQEAMMQQQRLAMEAQKLAQAEKQTQIENQMSQERLQKDFLLKQQQTDVVNAYRQAQLGLGKIKLAEEANQFEKTLAERADYHNAMVNRPVRPPAEQFDTVTEVFPGSEAVPEHSKGGFFGLGSKTVPATEATPERRVTRKVPMGSPVEDRDKSNGTATASSNASGKVRMINPDGVAGMVPANQVEAAKAQGYKLP